MGKKIAFGKGVRAGVHNKERRRGKLFSVNSEEKDFNR